ncbi:MAG: peptide chain release factor 2 [Planctomycetes bacterium]|nr:peptide chain release factor 2 [Planctomycetota bacterium]
MGLQEHKDVLKAADERLQSLKVGLDYVRRHRELADIEHRMSQPGFWDDAERAQKFVQEKKLCFQVVDPIDRIAQLVEDGQTLLEMGADDPSAVEQDLRDTGQKIDAELERLEFQLMLGGEHDQLNAIVTLQSGAGGVDASDFAEMMLRMYIKWASQHDYEVEETDFQKAEEAGIKNATIVIRGPYAYGRLKAEQGVHRLVRISPFDGQGRRQTSFASVEVVPELDDSIDVEIRKEDLKVDTFRASGAGGQHVNKTESAIRITHIPSGIVVSCQTERSQHKNRDSAMRALRSKLYQLELARREEELAKFYGDRGSISWGNQIRSYVLQPYQMCKDLRTDVETSDVDGVLDGDLDPYIEGYLKMRKDVAKK